MQKEYLYVGYYFDIKGRFILKIGTTNNLIRRQKEHTRNYRKCPEYTMSTDNVFEYLWSLPLSKYNTLRFEDKNRDKWIAENVGKFIRNDRFYCENIPETVKITIRKTYEFTVKNTVLGNYD